MLFCHYFNVSAIALSLFLRDAAGRNLVMPRSRRLPGGHSNLPAPLTLCTCEWIILLFSPAIDSSYYSLAFPSLVLGQPSGPVFSQALFLPGGRTSFHSLPHDPIKTDQISAPGWSLSGFFLNEPVLWSSCLCFFFFFLNTTSFSLTNFA